jgi:hypothetical protein
MSRSYTSSPPSVFVVCSGTVLAVCVCVCVCVCVRVHARTHTHTYTKDVHLEVNEENTIYMFMSHHQTTGQNHYTRVTNKSFENVAKFRYL